ncbi:hypothetical protein [Saccharibacillus alkalitolerans]|uniref:DUF4303 domain-containing protein n=1 Tax=Saccharibacillus alkalitolerans TaxID=2705290 RepID=A0ABX0F0E2_9BACL|nr:hypothetical protein [Saccharibacillus alkalitolerans]NGZ74356.1 hypothetical protein [Saccharibacillus alkalitolerans]
MSDFESYVFERIKSGIEAWNEEERNAIYVLSFYVECEEDDLRRPKLTFGSNTDSQYEESRFEASDAGEARWNYAYWLQNEQVVIGDDYVREGREEQLRRDEWVRSLPWFYTDEEEREDFERTLESGEKIVEAFGSVVQNVVTRLRSEGVVTGTFGRSLPLLVHGLEYSDETAKLNRKLNPGGEAEAFAAWIDSM